MILYNHTVCDLSSQLQVTSRSETYNCIYPRKSYINKVFIIIIIIIITSRVLCVISCVATTVRLGLTQTMRGHLITTNILSAISGVMLKTCLIKNGLRYHPSPCQNALITSEKHWQQCIQRNYFKFQVGLLNYVILKFNLTRQLINKLQL